MILVAVPILFAYHPFLCRCRCGTPGRSCSCRDAAVAVVYKWIKCDSMRDVPRQALSISLWIIGGMAAAACAGRARSIRPVAGRGSQVGLRDTYYLPAHSITFVIALML